MSDESRKSNRKSSSDTGDLVGWCTSTPSKDRDVVVVYRSWSTYAHSSRMYCVYHFSSRMEFYDDPDRDGGWLSVNHGRNRPPRRSSSGGKRTVRSFHEIMM